MALGKKSYSGYTTMLVLKVLEEQDMYGYQITQELERRSENVFALKTGTLYPILHGLEHEGLVSAYEKSAESGKLRRYYHLTQKGNDALRMQQEEWNTYTNAVRRVMEGGLSFATL